ncbi:MAG: RNA polymerase subunit sigma-70 [Thalassolituus sp.]|nr:MAG: RNA polymerase subunit sigma-70 [Thalassolituus sp.]
MTEQDHQTLIRAVAMGEQDAFQQLYESTSSRLYAIAMQLLRSPERADEALQEAYVKIWHNAGEYHAGRGAVITWMGSIVRYRCIDMLRSISRKEDRQDSLDDMALELAEAPVTEESSDYQAMEHCLAQLESGERQLVHLAYYRGLTHSEIEHHTGTPLGTVKTWIRRGLQALKRCLEQ